MSEYYCKFWKKKNYVPEEKNTIRDPQVKFQINHHMNLGQSKTQQADPWANWWKAGVRCSHWIFPWQPRPGFHAEKYAGYIKRRGFKTISSWMFILENTRAGAFRYLEEHGMAPVMEAGDMDIIYAKECWTSWA